MNSKEIFLKTILIMFVLLSACEARGGRRGGSFGGLFGGWRKYKKPSSGGGSSRRIVSSSPVHTPITKAWHENKKTNEKFQKNFKPNNMYNGYNTPPLPAGGSYYQNTAAIPGNAIYVAQAPPRGSEFGDFLTGYLTGRILTMGFSSPHYHVTHVYRESPSQVGNAVKSNTTYEIFNRNTQAETSTIKVFEAPLMEFPTTTTTESFSIIETQSATTQKSLNATIPPIPPYGVICIPMLLNETNTNGEAVQNERTVCYPAPAPPAPQTDIKSIPVEIAGDIMEH